MGIDITWHAFDADEVERMWSGMPFGELIEKMKDDSLFWRRKRNLMPDELQKERRPYSGFEYAEEIIKHLAKLGNNDKSIEWIIKNEGVDKFPREEIMYIDMDFIYYWNYDWDGGRFRHFSLLTKAAYLKTGIDFDEIDLPKESLTKRWFNTMNNLTREIVGALIIYERRLNKLKFFPKISSQKLKNLEEEIKWVMEDITRLIHVFEFAKKYNLEIFVSSETNDFEDDGAGKNSLLNRYKRKFENVASL